jgi:hypothetical protein
MLLEFLEFKHLWSMDLILITEILLAHNMNLHRNPRLDIFSCCLMPQIKRKVESVLSIPSLGKKFVVLHHGEVQVLRCELLEYIIKMPV